MTKLGVPKSGNAGSKIVVANIKKLILFGQNYSHLSFDFIILTFVK